MHRRVRDQSVLVVEVLAADLAGELRDAMDSFPVALHVGYAHTHEAALAARHRPRRV